MKIYTRKGDDGSTGLASGERVAKHDARVDMYGIADELNSFIGSAISGLAGVPLRDTNLTADLELQQNLLFELGSELAGFLGLGAQSALHAEDIKGLEDRIDAYNELIEPLKAFVLPGGSPPAAALHIARTVCRRLERRMTAAGPELVSALALQYVNRLSDYLFTAARLSNVLCGRDDIAWQSRAR